MAERDVAKACRQRWDALGLLWRRIEYIGRRGAPDFVVCGVHMHLISGVGRKANHGTVWVETKPPGGKPDPHQEREHQRLREAGQIVLIIDSVEALDRYFPLGG